MKIRSIKRNKEHVAASESKPLAAELDTFDHDDNAAGDEYEDDYAEIHGHPKFVDVTQEEAEKLSVNLTKPLSRSTFPTRSSTRPKT